VLEIHASKQHFLGMPVEEFLHGYWQKKPLLIRQALPDYQAPLAPEDLAGLACEETALSRLVQHDRKHDAWRVRSGPFDENEFPTLGDRDWTLLVQDMDKWDADVRALLDHFRFLPAWRVDDVMISFATKGGSVGPHVDQYDVFLLQAMGQRRWQIDADPRAPREFREDVELKLLKKFNPSNEWVLDPGDMLYLPPGVPHHGEAVDACMTFSVGMRAPSRAELLVDLAEELAGALPEEARYADPDLAEPRDAFEIDDAAFARVEQALSSLATMDANSRRRWFGRFITRYRSAGEIVPGDKPPTLANAEKKLADGGMLLRHPFARSAWTKQGKEALLFVDGESWQMDARSAHVLAAYEAIDDAALAKLSDSGRDALASLLRRGHYQLRKATRSRR
jgi:50S ribosomal protein L16 3-hydroxylase